MSLIIDNFAGGGGASSGIEAGLGRRIDYAINHDPEAIAMHRANHPHTKHLVTNVMDVDPVRLARGRGILLAWFSPDCTFHSKARGGKPFRDRDTARRRRGLAWSVTTWAKLARPEVIMLENVEEFADWGPLLPDGKICPQRRGMTFRRWHRMLENLGYSVDMRELVACDYGAPTTRKRLFVIARRDGGEIMFPEATHGPGLQPYRTAADCIDWSIPCPSIFDRKRPLAEATQRRIARGVMRYVVNNPEPFIVQVAHGDWGYRDGNRAKPIDQPLGPVTAGGIQHALVAPCIAGVGGRMGQSPERSVERPMQTITAKGDAAVVAAFLAQHNTGVTGHRADEPVSTITSRGTQQQLVMANLLHMRNHCDGRGVDESLRTVSAQGQHHGLVTSHLMKYYGTDQDPRLTAPLGTVTTKDRFAEVRAFLIRFYGQLKEAGLSVPLDTITTKDRFGLVTVHGQPYQIVDIGMRMLSPRELYRAQGFHDVYTIDHGIDEAGEIMPLTKTAQVRMCGNSVSPPVAEALVRANVAERREQVAA